MDNLLYKLQQGNIVAFEKFYIEYSPIVVLFAKRITNDLEISKEIANNAFLSFWERHQKFNSISNIKSFIFVTAKNYALNHLRSLHTPISNDEIKDLVGIDIEEFMAQQETYLILKKSIDNLPGQMQKIIRLQMEGLKNHEIATTLGISLNTVHTLKKRAYKKIHLFISNQK